MRDIQLFSEYIGTDKKAFFLISFWWTLFDGPNTISDILKLYRFHKGKFPNHVIIFLVNTIDEFRIFNRQGIKCRFINHNALVDPEIFKPIKCKKKYNIIYNARLEKSKRHYLLKDCEKISLLSAYIHEIDTEKKGYINSLKEDIPDAEIVNFENPKKLKNIEIKNGLPFLLPKKVCKVINMAKVGVMLSAKEGASYASIEYLLSGIPVVSTISQGGRDVFFDKRF